jgi:hypothetical protein
VWPRAYGGESVEENLLPACKSCNGRKGDIAMWALYPIQAIVCGFNMDESDFALVPKEARLAAHARIAGSMARADDISLKEAYVRLGPADMLNLVDGSLVVDVFNLTVPAGR